MGHVVTIITVAYNSMDYIYENIKSALSQDYPEIEIIIADDCSENFHKDEIIAYIEQNKKENLLHFEVYANKKNLGTVKNLNTALKKATGDLITILSADDVYYNDNVISQIVKEFDKTCCDFLITRRILFEGDYNNIISYIPDDYEIEKIKKFKTAEQERIGLYTGNMWNMASGCVFAYKKELLEELNYYDENYSLWDDGPFLEKYLEYKGKLYYNYDIISIYYRKGGMSSTELNPRLFKDLQFFLEKGLKDKRIKGLDRRYLQYRYIHDIKYYKKSKLKLYLYRLLYLDVIFLKMLTLIRKKTFSNI